MATRIENGEPRRSQATVAADALTDVGYWSPKLGPGNEPATRLKRLAAAATPWLLLGHSPFPIVLVGLRPGLAATGKPLGSLTEAPTALQVSTTSTPTFLPVAGAVVTAGQTYTIVESRPT